MPIGVVTAIAAPATLRVSLRGTGGHAGTVLMPDRRDALCGAAEVILAVEQAARNSGSPDTVATTGVCRVTPGAVNGIPARVTLDIDIRDIDPAPRDRVVDAIAAASTPIAAARGLHIEVQTLNRDRPAFAGAAVVAAVEASCRALGFPFLTMVSRAYHDSLFMACVAPTGMIFIPCRGGVSHRPDEYAAPDAIAQGVAVLAAALARLAGRGSALAIAVQEQMPKTLVESKVVSRSIHKIMVIPGIRHDKMSKTRPTRRALFRLSGGTALVGALAGSRELTHRSAASEEEQTGGHMIDTHIHVVPPALPGIKPMPEDVERLYKGPLSGMADRLKAAMDQAKLKFAFGMGSLEGLKEDPLGIARTLELSRSVLGLRAIGVADPRRTEPEHLRAVEAQIGRHREKIVAFKAYLGYLHFGPEDPNYVPYYRLAAKYHLPVILHTGDNWSTTAKVKYAHPLRMDEVAVDHPEVRFVLAHFGNPWLIDAAEVVFKNPNVWADLSGLFVGSDKEIQDLLEAARVSDSTPGLVVSDLKKAIGYVGDYKKFLYGSDWPLAPMSSYRRLIESLIPKEHHQEVFRTNAERLFFAVP